MTNNELNIFEVDIQSGQDLIELIRQEVHEENPSLELDNPLVVLPLSFVRISADKDINVIVDGVPVQGQVITIPPPMRKIVVSDSSKILCHYKYGDVIVGRVKETRRELQATNEIQQIKNAFLQDVEIDEEFVATQVKALLNLQSQIVALDSPLANSRQARVARQSLKGQRNRLRSTMVELGLIQVAEEEADYTTTSSVVESTIGLIAGLLGSSGSGSILDGVDLTWEDHIMTLSPDTTIDFIRVLYSDISTGGELLSVSPGAFVEFTKV